MTMTMRLPEDHPVRVRALATLHEFNRVCQGEDGIEAFGQYLHGYYHRTAGIDETRRDYRNGFYRSGWQDADKDLKALLS